MARGLKLLSALLIFVGAPSTPAFALNISLGPNPIPTPPATPTLTGPLGASIFGVQHASIYGLDGRDAMGNRIRYGQSEPGEPLSTHTMLTGRTMNHGMGGSAAGNQHATGVASIIIGSAHMGLTGIAPQGRIISSGDGHYAAIDYLMDPDGNPLNSDFAQVVNNSAGFTFTEKKSVVIDQRVNAGNYQLTFEGNTTGNLAWNASAAQVQAALVALPTLAAGDVSVICCFTDSGGNAYHEVMFKGTRHGVDVPGLGSIDVNMSGPTLPGGTSGVSTTLLNDGPGVANTNAGGRAQTLYTDLTVNTRDIIWVKSAGNDGFHGSRTITPVGDGHNVISVGATGVTTGGVTDYTTRASYSSQGDPTNGLYKPDLVAPGTAITMADNASNTATQSAQGTSFAAPHVAGMAGLLLEYRKDQGLDADLANHRVIKSVLLNSTSKHVRNSSAVAWPSTATATNAAVPLDPELGTGMLNGMAAVRQFANPDARNQGVELSFLEPDGGPPGAKDSETWSIGSEALKRGSLVTATLVWDRPVRLESPGADRMDAANYVGKGLPNLNLKLFREGSNVPVASSTSGGVSDTGGSSVEHIYFNVPADGNYFILVENEHDGPANTPYAVSWFGGSTDGLAFSVNARAEGLAGPLGGHPSVNDVYALGEAGPGHFPTQAEIFVSGQDEQNMLRLSGGLQTRSRVGPFNGPPAAEALLAGTGASTGIFGLTPGDNIVGLSWGTDGTGLAGGVLLFSVDPATTGGSDVAVQATGTGTTGTVGTPFPRNPGGGDPGDEAAGDIFKTPVYEPFGAYGSQVIGPAPLGTNRLFVDEEKLGLQAPRSRGGVNTGAEDDLNALEMTSPLATVDTDGNGLHDKPVFFLLGAGSPALDTTPTAPADPTPDDIFVSATPNTFGVYATGEQIINSIGTHPAGLELDALVLSDVAALPPLVLPGSPIPRVMTQGFIESADGLVDAFGRDTALVSFARGHAPPGANSSTVYFIDFQREFNPDTHFLATEEVAGPPMRKIPGSFYATAGSFAMGGTDEVNALDIRRPIGVGTPKRFDLVPGVPVIVGDPGQPSQDLTWVVTTGGNPAQPVEITTISTAGGVTVLDNMGVPEPQPLPLVVQGFDSGGVDGVFTIDGQDQSGTRAFFETFVADPLQQIGQQTTVVFNLEITDLFDNPLPLKLFEDDTPVAVTTTSSLFSAEFGLEIPGTNDCQQWRFEGDINLAQGVTFEMVEIMPITLTGNPLELTYDTLNSYLAPDEFLSSFSIAVSLATSPGFDPLLPLFSGTLESLEIVPLLVVPEPGTSGLLLLGLAWMWRHRRRQGSLAAQASIE